MYPYSLDLHLGGLAIHLYGVMMAVGFMAGLASWCLVGRRERRSFEFCSDLLFWVMVSGIAGARLAYVLSNVGAFSAAPLSVLFIWQGGLIYYGGLLAAALALLLFARVRGEKPLALCDFVVTSLPLAHAFGRIGCFFNGCCYGGIWHGWAAVRYPPRSAPWCDQVAAGLISRFAPQSAPVHPVQLYEAAINLVLYVLLVAVYRRRRRDGLVSALYLLTYPLARFWLETFRGDERMPCLGLSVAQALSLALLALGGWFLWLALRPAARPAGADRGSSADQ